MDAIDVAIMQALRKAGRETSSLLAQKLSWQGAGKKHAGSPNPSSKPGDYPAIQSGRLAASISSADGPGLSVMIGALNNPPPEALELILRPPSQGGRDWLTKAKHDPEIHNALRRGMRR